MKKFIWIVLLLLCIVPVLYYFSGSTMAHKKASRKALHVGVPAEGRLELTDEEWKSRLDPTVYHVTREGGTERAFTGKTWNTKAPGVYHCACCQQKLFDAESKYESGTGWPSFWKPIDENAVSLFEDRSLWMSRVEVVCSRCDAHLGHVFDDGPEPTGKRYCMNSAALQFEARAQSE